MSYTERSLTSDFHKYLRVNKPKELQHSFLIEFKCKHGKEKLHLIRDFQPHQLPTLLQATTGCVYHKMSDMSIGAKPCDSFQSCLVKAYLGVLWYLPRQPKYLYLIPIQQIKAIMDLGENKITEFMAEKLADHIIKL